MANPIWHRFLFNLSALVNQDTRINTLIYLADVRVHSFQIHHSRSLVRAANTFTHTEQLASFASQALCHTARRMLDWALVLDAEEIYKVFQGDAAAFRVH